MFKGFITGNVSTSSAQGLLFIINQFLDDIKSHWSLVLFCIFISFLIMAILNIYPCYMILKNRNMKYQWLAFIPVVGFIYTLVDLPQGVYRIFNFEFKNRWICFVILFISSCFVVTCIKTGAFSISASNIFGKVIFSIILLVVLYFLLRFFEDFYECFDGVTHTIISILSIIFPPLITIMLWFMKDKESVDIFVDYGNYEAGEYADTGITQEQLPYNLDKYKHNMRELDYRSHNDADYSNLGKLNKSNLVKPDSEITSDELLKREKECVGRVNPEDSTLNLNHISKVNYGLESDLEDSRNGNTDEEPFNPFKI